MISFDVVVLGGGPGGERAAIQAARAGKRVALVERENVVGGMRVNWGTIPSKTLRESATFVHGLRHNKLDAIKVEIAQTITIPELMYREQRVVQRELELINRSLSRYAIEIFRGEGRFLDAHTIAVHGVDGQVRLRLRGDVIVIATGSAPNRPADIALRRRDRVRQHDGAAPAADAALDDRARCGSDRRRVRVDLRRARALGHAGRHARRSAAVRRSRDCRPPAPGAPAARRRVHLERALRRGRTPGGHAAHGAGHDAQAATCSRPTSLLYCVGRDGNSRGLGLEAIGITPDARGLLAVNEKFQTVHPHIYAVGDVIGYPALASTSMEQGRQAIRNAYGIPGPKLRTSRLPFAIYAIPEVSYVGDTEESLKEKGIAFVVGRGHYEMNPKGQIVGATGGVVKLLFERETLVLRGAHIIGHSASELIHIGQAFLDANADAAHIAETLYNYPTFSDMYRHAALVALLAREQREPGERTEGEPV